MAVPSWLLIKTSGESTSHRAPRRRMRTSHSCQITSAARAGEMQLGEIVTRCGVRHPNNLWCGIRGKNASCQSIFYIILSYLVAFYTYLYSQICWLLLMGFLEASAKSGAAADEECEQAWFFFLDFRGSRCRMIWRLGQNGGAPSMAKKNRTRLWFFGFQKFGTSVVTA